METFRTYKEAVHMNDRAHQLTVRQVATSDSPDWKERLEAVADEARTWLDYLAWVHREAQYRVLNHPK